MESRAQAGGMEYIMTYGWALIFLFTIVGALILIGHTPEEDMSCRLTESADLLLKDFYLPFNPESSLENRLFWGDSSLFNGHGETKAEIVIQNVSAGKLKLKQVYFDPAAGKGSEICEHGELFGWQLSGPEPDSAKARFSIGEFNGHAIFPNCGGKEFVEVGEGQDLRFQKISFSLSGNTGSESLFDYWKSARQSTVVLSLVYDDAFGSEKTARVLCENFPQKPVMQN